MSEPNMSPVESTSVANSATAPHPINAAQNYSDPYPMYRRLLSESPVLWDSTLGCWYVLGYQEVAAALKDPRLSANRLHALLGRLPSSLNEAMQPFRETTSQWAIFLDAPHHTRIRTWLNKAFMPRLIQDMEPKIRSLVSELLDRLPVQGEFDVIRELAYPLPAIVIAEMLGVRPEDRDLFKQWSDNIAYIFGSNFSVPEFAQRASQSIAEMKAYLREVLKKRQAEPQHDLMSSLIAARENGAMLSEDELLSTCVMLMFGGHETTTNLIGNGLYALLRHPDSYRQLRTNPALIKNAVEELLRFDSPVQRTARIAAEDIELGNEKIHKGQLVSLVIGAANRDPSQFTEPDRLDLGRQENSHLSFGHGAHFCVGANLGRLEGQIALQMTLARFKTMTPLSEGTAWKPNLSFRGLQSFRVAGEA